MRGLEYGVRHLTVESPSSLLDFVSALSSAERARELLHLGSIYLNEQRAQADASLKPGDKVRVHLEPRRYQRPSSLKSRITENHSDYLVVDKPAGLPVHALVDNQRENLISFLEEEMKQKLFVTHRLDVETTGLVILAKTPDAQARLNEDFKLQKLKRTYLALVGKPLDPGPIVHFMKQSPKAPKEVSTHDFENSLRCELRIKTVTEIQIPPQAIELPTTEDKSWKLEGLGPQQVFQLEIELVTGRTHQIRAQLSALGAPLIGDQMYGSTFTLRDRDTNASAIALWAFRIQTKSHEKLSRPS